MDPFTFFQSHQIKHKLSAALAAINEAQQSGDAAALAAATTEGLKATMQAVIEITSVLGDVKRERNSPGLGSGGFV